MKFEVVVLIPKNHTKHEKKIKHMQKQSQAYAVKL